jgi:hypothetical protein
MTELEKMDELTDEQTILYTSLSHFVYSNKWNSYEAEHYSKINLFDKSYF